VDTLWRQFSDQLWCGVDDRFHLYIHELQIDNLGAVGDRLLLDKMGFNTVPSGLEERAFEVMQTYMKVDPREAHDPDHKFGGPTRHKRVFSYAEYQFWGACIELQPFEGAMLQENGARTSNSLRTPLRAIPLPINQRVDRTACSEFLLLSELCTLLTEAGVQDEKHRFEITGVFRLFSTGPSCISCCFALWQWHRLYEGVEVQIGYTQHHAADVVELRH